MYPNSSYHSGGDNTSMCPSQGSCHPSSKARSISDTSDDPYLLARVSHHTSSSRTDLEEEEEPSDPLLPSTSPASSTHQQQQQQQQHHQQFLSHHLPQHNPTPLPSTRICINNSSSSSPHAHADVHNPVYLPSINNSNNIQVLCSDPPNNFSMNNLRQPSIVSSRRKSQDVGSLEPSPGLKCVEPPTVPVIHYLTLANVPNEEEYAQVCSCDQGGIFLNLNLTVLLL